MSTRNDDGGALCISRSTREPAASRISTLVREITTESPSSRYATVSVNGASAMASEPRYISPSP